MPSSPPSARKVQRGKKRRGVKQLLFIRFKKKEEGKRV